MKKICIIGCGVSGLSTALLLQNQGYDVSIISKHHPIHSEADSAFGSFYPAASIIPHSVSSTILSSLFEDSLAEFKKLYNKHFPGLRKHQHYELFAYSRSIPAYAAKIDKFEAFADFAHSFRPQHPTIAVNSGWRFECYFADWEQYYPALFHSFLENGGTLKIQDLNKETLRQLPFDCIINCSELGSIALFEDEHKLIYKGHILQVKEAPKLVNPLGQTVSYNFSAGAEVYASENGNEQDIYCYPRNDGWVLGGSRKEGIMDEDGNWLGEQAIAPTHSVNGTVIPAQIKNLHRAIIAETFGFELDNFSRQSVKIGYRYIRKKENGLRLEAEEIGDKLFIHNYGHGGAGVTISWGCAKKVIEILAEHE